MPNEQEDFLKDLNPKDEQITEPVGETVVPEKEATTDDEPSNRRERRLRAKYEAERESSIALAAKLEALTEAQKFRADTTTEYDDVVERIYGTATPEAAEATKLLQRALEGVKTKATEDALKAFREEQAREKQDVEKEEVRLDSMLEELEDEYNVDLTSPSADQTRKGFFQLLERLSPKDRGGNIIEYADHHAVWEELQSRKPTTNNRAKDLASRSMVKTGSSSTTETDDAATIRFLKENGII